MYRRAQAYEDYRQNHILTAPPERLLILLFEALTTNVSLARQAMENDDAPGRREHLRKARDIVMELSDSLDFSVGGQIALNLNRLYAYVNKELVKADVKVDVIHIENAQRVLVVMDEMWRQAVENFNREKIAANVG